MFKRDFSIDTNRGYAIPCRLYEADKKAYKTIIAIHGFAGDKDSSTILDLAEIMTKQNVNVITFDLVCHGESKANKNKLSLINLLLDLEQVFRYASTLSSLTDIFATSFGAYLTLLFIANYKVNINKIVLRAPAICMDKILKNNLIENFKEFEQNGHASAGFYPKIDVSYSFYKEINANNILLRGDFRNRNYNIIVIHGICDDTASILDSRNFCDYNNITLLEMPNVGHRFKEKGAKEIVLNIASAFFGNEYTDKIR